MTTRQPSIAGSSLAAALSDDPFYTALVADLPASSPARGERLGHYFDYALREGASHRVRVADARQGAAIWLLPEADDRRRAREAAKRRALSAILGPPGYARYAEMIASMEAQSAPIIPPASWYLSILGVDPRWQGRGIGAALLRPTLAEIDAQAAPCYLETFGARSTIFYRRLGFAEIAALSEPLTGAPYWIMLRQPRTS
jgi:ribosomal protein S18 acetylase RimI-like enzyme